MNRRDGNGRVAPALRRLGPAIVIAAALALWEAASDFNWISPFEFPSPIRLAGALWDLLTIGFPDGITLREHFVVTVTRILEGFAIAMALAVPLGLVIGRVALLDALLAPIVTLARSVATLSLLPLAIIWFGSGEGSKVFLIGYACFWVMVTNVIAAAKDVDPMLIRAARSMDVIGPRLFARVILPATLPRMLAGARVALGVGFMVIVGAEMIGTIRGLGALIMEARNFYRTDISLVGMAMLGLIGFVLTVGLSTLERWLLPWHSALATVRR